MLSMVGCIAYVDLPDATVNTLTGNVGKGKAIKASVSAYKEDNTLLGTDINLIDGTYSIPSGDYAGKVRIVANITEYIDEKLNFHIRYFEGGFTQPNQKVNIQMIKWVLDNLEQKDDLCEYEIFSLLRNILMYVDEYNEEIEKSKLEKCSIDAEIMDKLVEILLEDDELKSKISFEVYVEYDSKENPKKVWDNENNNN